MTPDQTAAMASVICEVIEERHRQHAKWGTQDLPDGTGGIPAEDRARLAQQEADAAAKADTLTYRHILAEEVAEVFAETDPARIRAELIQVSAVASQWVEAIDRRARASGWDANGSEVTP